MCNDFLLSEHFKTYSQFLHCCFASNSLCNVHIHISQQSSPQTPGISHGEEEQLRATITDLESQITDITDQLDAKEKVEKKLSKEKSNFKTENDFTHLLYVHMNVCCSPCENGCVVNGICVTAVDCVICFV